MDMIKVLNIYLELYAFKSLKLNNISIYDYYKFSNVNCIFFINYNNIFNFVDIPESQT